MAYEYVKVILYAYPHLAALADAAGVAAENKALLSFRSRRGTLEEMERVTEELAVRSRLLRVRTAADAFVRSCSEEECFFARVPIFSAQEKAQGVCRVCRALVGADVFSQTERSFETSRKQFCGAGLDKRGL